VWPLNLKPLEAHRRRPFGNGGLPRARRGGKKSVPQAARRLPDDFPQESGDKPLKYLRECGALLE
jgi:hypothetical protein